MGGTAPAEHLLVKRGAFGENLGAGFLARPRLHQGQPPDCQPAVRGLADVQRLVFHPAGLDGRSLNAGFHRLVGRPIAEKAEGGAGALVADAIELRHRRFGGFGERGRAFDTGGGGGGGGGGGSLFDYFLFLAFVVDVFRPH